MREVPLPPSLSPPSPPPFPSSHAKPNHPPFFSFLSFIFQFLNVFLCFFDF